MLQDQGPNQDQGANNVAKFKRFDTASNSLTGPKQLIRIATGATLVRGESLVAELALLKELSVFYLLLAIGYPRL